MKLFNFLLCLLFIDQSLCRFDPDSIQVEDLKNLKESFPNLLKLKLKKHNYYYHEQEFCPKDAIILPKSWVRRGRDPDCDEVMYYCGTEIVDKSLNDILEEGLRYMRNMPQILTIFLNAIESVCFSFMDRFIDYALGLEEGVKMNIFIKDEILETLIMMGATFERQSIPRDVINLLKNTLLLEYSVKSEKPKENEEDKPKESEDDKPEESEDEKPMESEKVKTKENEEEEIMMRETGIDFLDDDDDDDDIIGIDYVQYKTELLRCKEMLKDKLDFTDAFSQIKYPDGASAEKKLKIDIAYVSKLFINPRFEMMSMNHIMGKLAPKRSTSIKIGG